MSDIKIGSKLTYTESTIPSHMTKGNNYLVFGEINMDDSNVWYISNDTGTFGSWSKGYINEFFNLKSEGSMSGIKILDKYKCMKLCNINFTVGNEYTVCDTSKENPLFTDDKGKSRGVGVGTLNNYFSKVVDIKIPVKWINKKGIKFVIGDIVCAENFRPYKLNDAGVEHLNDNEYFSDHFITEFADRENTGVQPVDGWVPIDCCSPGLTMINVFAEGRVWSMGRSCDIKSWRPNAEALYEIYLAEQESEKLKFYCSGFCKEDFTEKEAIDITIIGEYDRPVNVNKMTIEQITTGAKVSPGFEAFKMKDGIYSWNCLCTQAPLAVGIPDVKITVDKAWKEPPEVNEGKPIYTTGKFTIIEEGADPKSTFLPEDPSKVKVTAPCDGKIPKPIYTEEMHEAGEWPPVGCELIHYQDGKVEIIYSSCSFILYKDKDGNECSGSINSFEPIETKTKIENVASYLSEQNGGDCTSMAERVIQICDQYKE